MEEVWKDVVGYPEYEGRYQVSNLGRLRVTAGSKAGSRGRISRRKEKIIKATLGQNGYMMISIGRIYKTTLHRVVANHFCHKPCGKNHIDHINSDRTDNRASNLQWVTQQENNAKQKHSSGEEHFNSKLTARDVWYIRDEFDRLSQRGEYGVYSKIAHGHGLNNMVTVHDIIKGRTWKHLKKR